MAVLDQLALNELSSNVTFPKC